MRTLLYLTMVALASLCACSCSRDPADQYIDQQLEVARKQGVTVSPEQERQLRDAAHRGYEMERERLKAEQEAAMRRGEYVPDPIR